MREMKVHGPRTTVNGRAFYRRLSTVYCRPLSVVCALILLISTPVSAQYSGYDPIKDPRTFRKEFSTHSGKITSIESNFTQEKILTALTEKITSTGTFRFKRSNKVRFEYVKPFVYLMIMNGDKLLIRDDQKESRVNVRSNKMFQQINRIIIDCLQGTILESKDFGSRIFENEKFYLLEMTPVSKTLGSFFKTIVLVIDQKDYSARSIEMNEPGGDQTVITFTEKKLNVPVPDEVFAL